MPLWLVALLFLVGLAWIADRSVSKLTESVTKAVETITDFTQDEDWPEYRPIPTFADRVTYLGEEIGALGRRLDDIGRFLQPMTAIAEYRMEKIGWDRFLMLHRKMDEIIELANQQKRHRKLMRDEHGFPRLVYEDEVATAFQRGWALHEQFSIVLTKVGPNSINVIRAVRAVTGLNLKDAKDLVDGAPKCIKEGASKEEAATIKKKFEDVGATVEVKVDRIRD